MSLSPVCLHVWLKKLLFQHRRSLLFDDGVGVGRRNHGGNSGGKTLCYDCGVGSEKGLGRAEISFFLPQDAQFKVALAAQNLRTAD